jgi:hypothetical protein
MERKYPVSGDTNGEQRAYAAFYDGRVRRVVQS